jgi:DMSO/TMAO reductase YedYZ molybdopterin-dependent catalytic subunit
MIDRLEDRELKRRSRRELLKLAPLAALGVFAIPQASDWLEGEGVRFSDWAAGKLFQRQHLAQTFSNASVVPFEKFPYNGYDALDPEVDLPNWTLTVEGDVQRPGEYKLAQVQALP